MSIKNYEHFFTQLNNVTRTTLHSGSPCGISAETLFDFVYSMVLGDIRLEAVIPLTYNKTIVTHDFWPPSPESVQLTVSYQVTDNGQEAMPRQLFIVNVNKYTEEQRAARHELLEYCAIKFMEAAARAKNDQ